MKNAHISSIFEALKRSRGHGTSDRLKKRLHSAAGFVNEALPHLIVCKECLAEINRFFLTAASSGEYGQILTPKGNHIIDIRRWLLGEEKDDGVYLVGVEIPEKVTLYYHEVIIAFMSHLEIHQAVRRLRESLAAVGLPSFGGIGLERAGLYRMSSQGHYEAFRGGEYKRHGKRTVVDIFGSPSVR
jgi:hypothetical protein